MRIYLCAFSLFFILQVSAQKNISNSFDSLTQIKKTQYSLSYPGTWRVDNNKMFGADLLLLSAKTDSLDLFIENFSIFVQDLHGQNYNLLKMGQESENQIKNIVTDVEIIESRLDSTASQVYYVLKYKGRQGKFLLITEQRYYLQKEIGFALTFTLQNGKEKEYALTSKAIFESFKLLN